MQTALYIPSLIVDIAGLQAALDANEALANTKATPGYVDAAVAALVDSSPAALDTLNELAAALGDDANFATTVTDSLATKLTQAQADALYKPLSYVPAWGEITGIPTTLAGYGLTADADARYLQLSGGTLTGALVSNVNPALKSTTGELILEQNGEGFGTTRLRLQNRAGSAGALFENAGLDLVDFGFRGSSGTQRNIRLENRSGSTLTGTQPEWQIGGTFTGSLDNTTLGITDSLIYANKQTRFSCLGSATNDSTQDALRIQPSGTVLANYRAWAFYAASGDTVPRTFLGKTGDVIYNDSATGTIFKSPDGHYWRVTVSNAGALTTADLGTSLPA